jgi:preprotein translocase subunit SecA
MHPKLAGMTGTAMTEAAEFAEIYGLEVVSVPTHMPLSRADEDDEVYRTTDEKAVAIIEQIEDCHKRKQPVLVGTVSIEKSEMLAAALKKHKVPHNVLNARFHEQEAHIIAQAGRPGAVTIATNMAGRGTDIQLGGNLEMRTADEAAEIDDEAKRAAKIKQIEDEIGADRQIVLDAGGLCVIGTERHESRRIDNQLRGRSGRQGDPGLSKFYLSLEDDLMRIFASDRLDGMLQKLGLKEGEAIIHPWINKALEKAQQKVEARNFEIRKNLLKFDNVMNDQRRSIYEDRKGIMGANEVSEMVGDMRHDVIAEMVHEAIPPNSYAEQWDTAGLATKIRHVLAIDLPVAEWAQEEGIAEPEIEERVRQSSDRKMAEKAANYGPELMRMVEKSLLLQLLDQIWKDHLLTLDHLRQGISLRAYGQRDPLREYQAEAFELFQTMQAGLRETVTRALSVVEVQARNAEDTVVMHPRAQETRETRQDPAAGGGQAQPARATGTYGGGTPSTGGSGGANTVRRMPPPGVAPDPKIPETWGKVARNAACPCGSGKKYKHCHGSV